MNGQTGPEPGASVHAAWSFRTTVHDASSPLAPWPGGRTATKSPANGLFLLLTVLLAAGCAFLCAALTGDEGNAPLAGLTVLLGGGGVLTTVNGVLARQADPPGFIDEYRGGPCVPLTALYSGICLLSLAAFTFSFIPFVRESLPMLLLSLLLPPLLPALRIALLLIALASGVVHLRGCFSRYPRFLLPAWYRLALQAGVRAEDPMELRRFRALPPAEQRRRVAERQRLLSDLLPEREANASAEPAPSADPAVLRQALGGRGHEAFLVEPGAAGISAGFAPTVLGAPGVPGSDAPAPQGPGATNAPRPNGPGATDAPRPDRPGTTDASRPDGPGAQGAMPA
ncbi:MAG: hypothetical protein Q4E05_00910 [Pseudoclavibacter sp.]|nr:hypothetical protein [Pseudoclavibacter sp.]